MRTKRHQLTGNLNVARLTVAIPTCNRSRLLRRAIQSVLSQTLEDFELLILDNASADDTSEIVSQICDSRLVYHRHATDIGIVENWNMAIALSNREYLSIFHDDDVMHPTLLEKSVDILDRNPSVGFTFPLVRRVDLSGNFLSMWFTNYNTSGLTRGHAYLLNTISAQRCISLIPSMVFRRSIHEIAGNYRQRFGINTFDFNMILRTALHFDVYQINETLFDRTIHTGQMCQRHWRQPASPSGAISSCLEILDVLGKLGTFKWSDFSFGADFVSDQVIKTTERLGGHLKAAIPDM